MRSLILVLLLAACTPRTPAGPLTSSMECSYDAETYDWQLHIVYRDRNGHAIDRSPAAGACHRPT